MKLNYIQRLTLAVLFTKDKHPTGVLTTSVAHDSWCDFYKGQDCSCTPDIKIEIDGTEFQVDEEGAVYEKKDTH